MTTHEISLDGKSIKCGTCGLTSHHPKDVEHGYCGKCARFHPGFPLNGDQIRILQALRAGGDPPAGLKENPHRMLLALFQREYLDQSGGRVRLTGRAVHELDTLAQV